MAAANGMPEVEDVKKKAMVRLAVAAAITATALAGLWWLDQDGDTRGRKPPVPSAPAPIVPAPAGVTEAPVDQPLAEETPADATHAQTGAAVQPAEPDARADPPREPPPPPRVSNEPRGIVRPPASAPTGAPAVPPVTAPPPAAPTPRTATRPASPESVPGAAAGYVVQLGVFSNPENARELVQRLQRQGISARMETRVHVGPFLDQQEAEKARAELARLGYSPLVTTVAPRK